VILTSPLTTRNPQRVTRNSQHEPINQFELIMQNKPNLPNAQMNINTIITKDYENKRLCRCVKTKPIQTQYKAKTNPIPEKPKMKLNSYSTKDYENKPPSSPKKTNPKQTQLVAA